MTTVQQNNVVILKEQPAMFPAAQDGTFDIRAGDLVYFDTSAKIIKALDSDAHAATLVGVAVDGSKINVYGVDKYFPAIPVARKAITRLYMTSGDTYKHGDAVYFGADAQTITNTAGGNTHIVGYVSLPQDYSAAGVAYAAGVKIEIDLAVAFPTTAFA